MTRNQKLRRNDFMFMVILLACWWGALLWIGFKGG